jgi:hypothetical protein
MIFDNIYLIAIENKATGYNLDSHNTNQEHISFTNNSLDSFYNTTQKTVNTTGKNDSCLCWVLQEMLMEANKCMCCDCRTGGLSLSLVVAIPFRLFLIILYIFVIEIYSS